MSSKFRRRPRIQPPPALCKKPPKAKPPGALWPPLAITAELAWNGPPNPPPPYYVNDVIALTHIPANKVYSGYTTGAPLLATNEPPQPAHRRRPPTSLTPTPIPYAPPTQPDYLYSELQYDLTPGNLLAKLVAWRYVPFPIILWEVWTDPFHVDPTQPIYVELTNWNNAPPGATIYEKLTS